MWLVRFGWEWRTAVEPERARTATLVAFLFFVLAISTSALTAVSFKQKAFFSAMNHHYPRIARVVRQNFSRDPKRGGSWWSRREYDYRLDTAR